MAEREAREEITVRAELRTGRGKNDARRTRREGLVPITVYGGADAAVAAVASLKELAAILRSETGPNTIFTLHVNGVGASQVMFHDRQIDPLRGRLVHADLRRLVLGQKIEVTVPIHLTGEPVGVREEEGHLEQVLRQIEIRCDPRFIPDAITLDVSHLGVHDSLHVSDIAADENIEILESPESVIVTVGLIREEEVAPVVAETEEPAEPEVIGKGKKEEETEGPTPKKEGPTPKKGEA